MKLHRIVRHVPSRPTSHHGKSPSRIRAPSVPSWQARRALKSPLAVSTGGSYGGLQRGGFSGRAGGAGAWQGVARTHSGWVASEVVIGPGAMQPASNPADPPNLQLNLAKVSKASTTTAIVNRRVFPRQQPRTVLGHMRSHDDIDSCSFKSYFCH